MGPQSSREEVLSALGECALRLGELRVCEDLPRAAQRVATAAVRAQELHKADAAVCVASIELLRALLRAAGDAGTLAAAVAAAGAVKAAVTALRQHLQREALVSQCLSLLSDLLGSPARAATLANCKAQDAAALLVRVVHTHTTSPDLHKVRRACPRDHGVANRTP